MRNLFVEFLLAVAVAIVAGPVLKAQDTADTGFLKLVVDDPSGGFIAGAKVIFQPSPGPLANDLKTDDSGSLTIRIPEGIYDVTITSPGFRRAIQHIDIRAGDSQTHTVVLQVGSGRPSVVRSWDYVDLVDLTPAALPSALHVSFPQYSRAVSPDGHFALSGDSEGTRVPPAVYLVDLNLKTVRKLFNYEQRVDVLWNSGSNLIATTEYLRDGGSRCRIIFANERGKNIDALGLLARQLSKTERERLKGETRSHDLYVEAVEWKHPNDLELKLRTQIHGNPLSSTHTYILHVNNGPG